MKKKNPGYFLQEGFMAEQELTRELCHHYTLTPHLPHEFTKTATGHDWYAISKHWEFTQPHSNKQKTQAGITPEVKPVGDFTNAPPIQSESKK